MKLKLLSRCILTLTSRGYPLYNALMAELADAQDLKSCVHLDVWVRVPVGVYGGYRYQLTRTRDY